MSLSRPNTVAKLLVSASVAVFSIVYLICLVSHFRYEPTQTQQSACTKDEKDCRVVAPFIFNSVSSLLKHWPNTYAPNGHTIAAATVPKNTQLYRVRYDGGPRKSPTFYAFDAVADHICKEMSLGIYGNSGSPRLYTMVTTRPLNVLYFDGQSAALTAFGTLDSQMALLQGEVPTNPSEQLIYDQNRKADDLCRLAEELSIDGFVRMNAGFEVLLCDGVSSGVIEVFQTDVTVPGNEERENDPTLPRGPNRVPPWGFGNEFAPQSSREWIRSGTWHYGGASSGGPGSHESRVLIDYCGIVTFYNSALQSLSSRHHGTDETYQGGWGLRRGHRLLDISRDDIATVKKWLREVIEAQKFQSRRCSGTYWQSLIDTITKQHRTRLEEIQASLKYAKDDQARLNASIVKVHGPEPRNLVSIS